MAEKRNGTNRVELLAAGDVSTGHEPPESAFFKVADRLRQADIRFCQVERVYSERGSFQTHSDGIHARHNPKLAEAFKSVPFDVVSIASNHTGDWGPQAVEDTRETFEKLGIAPIGAGRNITEARSEAVIERNGLRVAFLGYVSVILPHYWATDQRAGAAPMRAHTFYEPYEYQPGAPPRIVTIPHQKDLDSLVADVRRAKSAADVVVLSFHWGVHYIPKPADYQLTVAHAAIDAGAAAIIGHHPHQPQGIEVYKGAPIYYSLGNFAMNRKNRAKIGPWCVPNGEYTHKEVYDAEMDPGHYYEHRRHYYEGGMACLELDKAGVARATWLPTMMDGQNGQPSIVETADPQFETSRRYLEWASRMIPGGVNEVPAKDGRYVLYERG